MGLISINLDIMSPKKRLFAVSAFFCLTPSFRCNEGSRDFSLNATGEQKSVRE